MDRTKGLRREERYSEIGQVSRTLGAAVQLIEGRYPDLEIALLDDQPTQHKRMTGYRITICGQESFIGIEAHCELILTLGQIGIDEWLFGFALKGVKADDGA